MNREPPQPPVPPLSPPSRGPIPFKKKSPREELDDTLVAKGYKAVMDEVMHRSQQGDSDGAFALLRRAMDVPELGLAPPPLPAPPPPMHAAITIQAVQSKPANGFPKDSAQDAPKVVHIKFFNMDDSSSRIVMAIGDDTYVLDRTQLAQAINALGMVQPTRYTVTPIPGCCG